MTRTAERAQVRLTGDSAVTVTRRFKAPKPLVWRAYMEPALVRRWMLGPPGWSMPVCEVDLRAGGRYRWRWRSDADGAEFGFTGEFREVEPGIKVVHTQYFHQGETPEVESGDGAVVTVTFTEEPGDTTVTTTIDFGTREARDGVMATGMTDGMEQSYQLLDALLGEQQQGSVGSLA